jgi:RNA polymerase sigma-70 factor (ECF subfamily)
MLGMTYEEAAQIVGCEIGTVKSRVNRGRIRLAKILQLDVDLKELSDP